MSIVSFVLLIFQSRFEFEIYTPLYLSYPKVNRGYYYILCIRKGNP